MISDLNTVLQVFKRFPIKGSSNEDMQNPTAENSIWKKVKVERISLNQSTGITHLGKLTF